MIVADTDSLPERTSNQDMKAHRPADPHPELEAVGFLVEASRDGRHGIPQLGGVLDGYVSQSADPFRDERPKKIKRRER